jgi:hypothetical protein
VQTGSTCTSPAIGIPAGGQTLIITGTNFRQPVRVLFDPGNGVPAKEAFVSSVTPTQIVVAVPPFDVGTGQQLPVTITVINEAGTVNESKVSVQNGFTYQVAVLTPTVRSVAPTSGPIDGGTRISIFGDGFQSPVQVFFNSAEAQQLKVTFNEIDVISPAARDTTPNGSGTVTGPVDIKVRNVGSGKEATFPAGFRYIAKMQITTINPVAGSALGGTDVTIDGVGFNDPLTVDIAGVRAQVIRVSGTEVVARTGRLPSPCNAGAGGAVTVTNVDNGDFATSAGTQTFSYIGVPSVITGITVNSPPATPGGSLTVNVQNPGIGLLGNALISFTVGGQPAAVTPQTITTGTGTQPFSVVVPNTLTFPTVSCTVGALTGTQLGPLQASVVFTNTTTGCSSTSAQTITIQPPGPNPCVVPPTAVVTPAAPTCANATSAAADGPGGATGSAVINIANAGTQNLQVSAPAITGPNAADFTIAPATAQTIAPAANQNYNVTFDPGATGARSATVTFTTNDPAHPTITVCLTGNGT